MRLTKIYFFFSFLLLILSISAISYSKEDCSHDKTSQPNPNCACNALLDTLNLLNIKTTPDEISNLLPLDKDGLTSMYDLLEASKTKGLSPKALKLTYEQLTKTDMPVIAYLTTQHFITLKGIKENGIISIDKGRETFIPKDEFLKNWTGHTLVFNPKTKGIALSNKQLKQIKGSHCTCGGCSASDCNTGSCGGSKSCSSANCQGTCPEGGNCKWCPRVGSGAWCGGQAQRCGCLPGGSSCSTLWKCDQYCASLGSNCPQCSGTQPCNCTGYHCYCPEDCNKTSLNTTCQSSKSCKCACLWPAPCGDYTCEFCIETDEHCGFDVGNQFPGTTEVACPGPGW